MWRHIGRPKSWDYWQNPKTCRLPLEDELMSELVGRDGSPSKDRFADNRPRRESVEVAGSRHFLRSGVMGGGDG